MYASKTARLFNYADTFLNVLKFFGELDYDVRGKRQHSGMCGVVQVCAWVDVQRAWCRHCGGTDFGEDPVREVENRGHHEGTKGRPCPTIGALRRGNVLCDDVATCCVVMVW